ncbi:MAG TPA: DPP IV N-terminal domain-containing protein, partial [Pyrinomonadaceae bacterium]|nr:DPP IV N-terminal domain-containing protein [Pyrinomonadaceae bacterium]
MNTRKLGTSLLLLLLFSLTALAQQKLLTIDDIFDPAKRVNFSGTVPNVRWLKDGTHYLLTNDPARKDVPRLQKVDAVSGEAIAFFDAARMEAAFAAMSGISPADAKQIANRGSYQMNHAETAALINHKNDLYYYEFGSDKVIKVTNNPEDEEVGETFSPNDAMLAYVRKNDMFVFDIARATERRLTSDGGPKILNGRLDWVYQEELYGRGNFEAYWWSPDSTMLAYLRLDENPVHEFAVVDHIPYHQNVEETPYPQAGDPNPLVQLGVVNADGGPTRWVDNSKYTPADLLVVRVSWSPDGSKVVYQAQNREQTFLDLNFAEPKTGKSLNAFRESSRTWVEAIDNPTWLKNGSFIWQSARDGWRHLYLYDAKGKPVRQITTGKWEVRSVETVDEQNRFVYFTATEHSHVGVQPYRIKLDGTGLQRLTTAEGSHQASFSPDAKLFFDKW